MLPKSREKTTDHQIRGFADLDEAVTNVLFLCDPAADVSLQGEGRQLYTYEKQEEQVSKSGQTIHFCRGT